VIDEGGGSADALEISAARHIARVRFLYADEGANAAGKDPAVGRPLGELRRMKKLLLSLFVIAPMVPVTAAASTPVGALVPLMLVAPKQVSEVPSGGLPGATPGTPVLTCEGALDKMVADIQAGKMISQVNSTLIVGDTALAESPHFPLSAGFNPSGGSATRSGSTIVGTSHVAAPGTTSGADLKFTIDKANGKARLRWTHAGKSYTSSVDGCASGYWIASSATSAIAIKLGPMVTPAE
jgi:hypothetical protein